MNQERHSQVDWTDPETGQHHLKTANKSVKILGVDPGKTTGWATITVNDETKKIGPGLFGNCTDTSLVEINEHVAWADVVVYEGFWVRPDLAKAGGFDWGKMTAEEAIGSLRTLCKLNQNTPMVEQQPAQRVPGYSFAGMVYKKGAKGKHWQDAFAHAVFYAVTKLQAHPVRKN